MRTGPLSAVVISEQTPVCPARPDARHGLGTIAATARRVGRRLVTCGTEFRKSEKNCPFLPTGARDPCLRPVSPLSRRSRRPGCRPHAHADRQARHTPVLVVGVRNISLFAEAPLTRQSALAPTVRAGSCWALTTSEGSIISASRTLAGLLHVSPSQLRGCNLFSFLDGGLTDNTGSHATSSLSARCMTVSRRNAPAVPMQVTIFDHQENKLWLFSSAVAHRASIR